MNTLTPVSIWNEKQDHPELVVQDLVRELRLTPQEADLVRLVLLRRGVNKWLYNRGRFIQLKHQTKELMQQLRPKTRLHRVVCHIYEEMVHIANNPRWIEWGTHVHRKLKDNLGDCIVRGKSC